MICQGKTANLEERYGKWEKVSLFWQIFTPALMRTKLNINKVISTLERSALLVALKSQEIQGYIFFVLYLGES